MFPDHPSITAARVRAEPDYEGRLIVFRRAPPSAGEQDHFSRAWTSKAGKDTTLSNTSTEAEPKP